MTTGLLLILGPAHEMFEGLGEQTAADAGTGLLRGRVVHLFEYARHAEQIGGLETAQIGQQMLGPGQVTDHALAADGHVLNVPGETVRQRQEQHQSIRLVEHLVENDVAVEHDMSEIAMR